MSGTYPAADQLDQVFQTEDGDQLFVATAAFSWNRAQAEAKAYVPQVADDWSKAVYAGTKDIMLHIGCDWPWGCGDSDDGEPERHPRTRCYVFEVVER